MNASAHHGPRASVRRLIPSRRSEPRIRVMIVDDSLTVRTIFKRMVEHDPRMEVSSTASSAERAIAAIEKSPADVLLLDLEMPGMGGLKALPHILAASPDTQILVVSSLAAEGAETTLEALSQGAADTLLKPRPGEFTERYRTQLVGKIKALGKKEKISTPSLSDTQSASYSDSSTSAEHDTVIFAAAPAAPTAGAKAGRPEVIALGASTGGIHALNILLKTIGPECKAPILITQHLPPSFIPVFARQIEKVSGRPTQIAEEGTEIRKGEIVLATGDSHLCLTRKAGRLVTLSNTTPVSSGCLPSVDPMLTSLAKLYRERALAIMLSGMGRDGVEGARTLVEAGGEIWAQDADTSAVWGMPGAVVKGGLASFVAAPEALGAAIMDKISQKRDAAE